MMSKKLNELEAFGKDGELRVIVEVPRGSSVKLNYKPKLRSFVVSRALPLGLTYPFDWGFIPGTKGDDGDPLDAIALHETATYPGVILPCKPIGMVEISEKRNGASETNNRVIAMPLWNDRLGEFERVTELPERLKEELEQFFLNTAFFTSKKLKLNGWSDAKAATRFIKRSAVR